MIVVSAAGSDERVNLGTRDACEVVNSIGTDSYGDVCFAMLERALNAEHWALFRFRSGRPLKCVATASKRNKAAASSAFLDHRAWCPLEEPPRRAIFGFLTDRRALGAGPGHCALKWLLSQRSRI